LSKFLYGRWLNIGAKGRIYIVISEVKKMKKLIIICAVVGLLLSTTGVSWAVLVVDSPPDAPDWWNTEDTDYAYGWWENVSGTDVPPPNNETHWASNFLTNTDFTATVNWYGNIELDLTNVFNSDGVKEIYIYINGLHDDMPGDVPTLVSFNIGGSVFTGVNQGYSDGLDGYGSTYWHWVVSGVIDPQPASVSLVLHQNALFNVYNIWVGENCVPEPTTIGLLGLGSLTLLRKRKR
jgi:hypothetical protein